MLRNLLFCLLFLTAGCSEVQSLREGFLREIAGTWKVTREGAQWFVDNLSVNTVNPGDSVVITDGNFSLGGIDFRFIEVEDKGVIAVYSFVSSGTKYTGLGFGIKNNVLILPVFTSQESVQPAETGVVFLER